MDLLDYEVFAVSQIKTRKGGKTQDVSASGFFYSHKDELYFITNRHVICDDSPEELELSLHTDKDDLTKSAILKIPLSDTDGNKLWLEHSPIDDDDVDVAVLPIKNDMSQYYIKSFSKENIIENNLYISIGDDLLVVGYPLGIRDTKHKMPIIRRAIMASVYPLPFDGKSYFLIDSFLHDGTSGSPVLLKTGSTTRYLNGRVRPNQDRRTSYERKLIGIHSGSFIPTDWQPCDEENKEKGCPRIGLSIAWFIGLIPEIIEAQKSNLLLR
jgi:hypothetical protein